MLDICCNINILAKRNSSYWGFQHDVILSGGKKILERFDFSAGQRDSAKAKCAIVKYVNMYNVLCILCKYV